MPPVLSAIALATAEALPPVARKITRNARISASLNRQADLLTLKASLRLFGRRNARHTLADHEITDTPDEILRGVSAQINECCFDSVHPVHFVGHSLGGLLIRAYLGRHRVPQLGRVVLIGSPSKGTPVVDMFADRWWMKLAGPTAKALGTGAGAFPRTLSPPYYPLGVIAGVTDNGPMSTHIPGDDDGLVPVDSTRVEGMRDFIVLNTNHTMMRYDKGVAAQVIAFLRSGRFERP